MNYGVSGGGKYLALIVLVNTEFHIDLERINPVFQAEQGSVYFQLPHRTGYQSSLQIMNPEQAPAELNRVTCSPAIVRIEQDLLGYHLITDTVIDIQVESLPAGWKPDSQADRLMGKGMKRRAPGCHEMIRISGF
jgi:hypothetical protein